MLDITVFSNRVLCEQGFTGRPGAPGSKVMLMNISLDMCVCVYTCDNNCDWAAQRKTTAAEFLFCRGTPVIIVGKGSQYPGHLPAYWLPLVGQCACFLWKGTIFERSVNICMWYGLPVSWKTPLRQVKMLVIGCSVLEGGHDSLYPLVGVGSNKHDKRGNLTTTKLLFIQTRLFIQTSNKCFPNLQGQEGIGSIPGPRGPKVISSLNILLIRLHLMKEERMLLNSDHLRDMIITLSVCIMSNVCLRMISICLM